MSDVQLRRRASLLRVEHLEERCVLSANAITDELLITTAAGQAYAVKLADGQSAEDAMAAYLASPDVVAVERAQLVSIDATPDDASFGSQWGLNNTGQSSGTSDADIDANEAWELTTGTVEVAVGVIDTGIDYRHKDLYLNIWLNQGELRSGVVDTDDDGLITFRDLNHADNASLVSDVNTNGYIDAGDLLNDSNWEDGVDNDSNGYTDDLVGWDFVNSDNDPLDDNGHGTHVAGTIGAMTNNTTGVAGVTWITQLAALKFLGSTGSGSTAGAVSALNYANGEGIEITNNSWSGGGYSSAMNTAIGNARSAGYIFVAAAGNNSNDIDLSTVSSYPAEYSSANVVTVASTDRYDNLSSFSNYGDVEVDLAAPGSSILSTTRNNAYSTLSGTSMATPHVAGALALVWSRDLTQTYDEVIANVLDNVDVKSSLSGKVRTGGRLNLYAAVNAVGDDTTAPTVLSAVANGTTSVSSVLLTFSEAIDPDSFTTGDITGLTGFSAGTTASIAAVGTDNKQFRVTFSQAQTAAGSYSFKVGPDIFDTAATPNAMAQAYTASFSIVTETTTTFSNTTALTLPDLTTVYSSITISQDISISDLDVQLNITHTYNSDLKIYLVGPNSIGTVTLSNRRGGSGDNYTNTRFSDEASTAISSGSAPFNGTFRPEQALSAYDGKSAQGTWRLYITDNARYDTGKLNSWSLIITGTTGTTGQGLSEQEEAATAATPGRPAAVEARGTIVLSGLLPSEASASAVPQSSSAPRREEVPFNADVPLARREAADIVFGEMGGSAASADALEPGEDEFVIDAE